MVAACQALGVSPAKGKVVTEDLGAPEQELLSDEVERLRRELNEAFR